MILQYDEDEPGWYVVVCCPVCGRKTYAPGGVMVGHRNACATPDLLPFECMAGGLTQERAEALADSLRKAAHP